MAKLQYQLCLSRDSVNGKKGGVRTLYSCIISVAVYSWVLFSGANLISEGGKACDQIAELDITSLPTRTRLPSRRGQTDLVRDVAGSDLVEVVRPDRDEGALPGQVGVELVLQVDKARVAELVKLDVAEDGRGKVRADLGRLGLDADRSLLALSTH